KGRCDPAPNSVELPLKGVHEQLSQLHQQQQVNRCVNSQPGQLLQPKPHHLPPSFQNEIWQGFSPMHWPCCLSTGRTPNRTRPTSPKTLGRLMLLDAAQSSWSCRICHRASPLSV